ncbi:MAG: IS110 family transposase, partial [Actinobacteria bacterium]|nr:IS110 family transposase [Actinomycetota bacterium]
MSMIEEVAVMRTVALDVHKRFAEVAVHEDGAVRRLGRFETGQLWAFAASLSSQDHVVLESTAMTWAIAELLAEHAGRVTVSNPMRTRAIAAAKVKTDKIDAKVLAQLGAADFLPEVWAPDEVTRALRRRIAHRSSLVVQRTRLRNQIHAVLTRNLIDAPMTDVFGVAGRAWLVAVKLVVHEREAVDSNLRLHDALNAEIELIEHQLAGQALARADVRRLMTIPGVGAITALALVAVIGDVTRFPDQRHLVGYLGLDPRVRQSGEKAARHGHISRAGQAHARGLLIEAAHTAIRTPGPLRAFNARIATRRGKQIAICATARKLTVLAWHLLSKDEDYRYGAATITQRKLRNLQRKAGDNGPKISLAGETNAKVLEQRFLQEAERNYQRYVATKTRTGAGAANGDTTAVAVKAADDARQAPQSPEACS